MAEQLHVGIAQFKIAKAPDTLAALGLGSCVGTIIYDQQHKIGGLSHVMLPDSQLFTNGQENNVAKFANLALPAMVAALRQAGAVGNLQAKIVGGAQMFKSSASNMQLNIGERNISAVEATLAKLKIPIVARHVGGSSGRTMIVDLQTFDTTIRIVHAETIHI